MFRRASNAYRVPSQDDSPTKPPASYQSLHVTNLGTTPQVTPKQKGMMLRRASTTYQVPNKFTAQI